MRTFVIRVINLVLIVGILIAFQCVVSNRAEKEAAAQEEYELELEKQEEAREKAEAAASEEAKKLTTAPLESDVIETESTTETMPVFRYQDGTYSGSAQGYGGTVSVEVTIESDVILAIHVTDASHEDGAYFDAAQGVIDEMLAAQSTEVDVVSGATFSSNGIIHAVEDALEKAEVTQ